MIFEDPDQKAKDAQKPPILTAEEEEKKKKLMEKKKRYLRESI
jgi:hypothetical protein